ncbi:ROK family protein [Streptomyces pacificus]|uniref:ROK family protein n=1 Tax=Streptomyces pacificus TaxID=2705029 RepID=A0A6A0AZ70_9ACTN|nr:ROK family protein [Streptomyces pacificus]GFH38250.1 ROK family protein [Streptomyces pacificus]
MPYLGIDIGGTKAALLLERSGSSRPARLRFTWPRDGDAESDLDALASAVSRITADAGLDGPRGIRAAGLALPATVREGRITAWPCRPSWTGLRLDALLERVLAGIPVVHEDDGNLAALAEAADSGVPDLAYLGLGTGVGGGIVLGGRLHTGPLGGAAEIGHLLIGLGGAACACGRAGCLQAVASGPATLARAAALRGAPVDAAAFRTGLAEDSPWATGPLRQTAAALAVTAVNLGELLQCREIRIGGGFGHGTPGLLGLIRAETRRLTRPGTEPPAIRRAAHGADASLHGAALLARTASPGQPSASRQPQQFP